MKRNITITLDDDIYEFINQIFIDKGTFKKSKIVNDMLRKCMEPVGAKQMAKFHNNIAKAWDELAMDREEEIVEEEI